MYSRFFKRLIDFTLSITALIILSPILLLLIVVGAIVMEGNPFFVQKRPGMIDKKTGEERIVSLLKFRTMTNKCDENGKLLHDSKRLVPYGRFLRKTSLDELPSLCNVVKGDLSLIGPRPLLIKYLPRYSPEQRRRHEVRPGITGYAQAYGRNSITWEERFEKDVFYVDNVSLLLDIKILIKTFMSVLNHEGISGGGFETMRDFLGSEGEEIKTPYFLIKESLLNQNVVEFQSALHSIWPNSNLAYSVKTNSLPWVLKYMKEHNVMAEVVSEEEYNLAILCGFLPDQIIFNGPIKEARIFEYALQGNSFINMDSEKEISLLKSMTKVNGCNFGIRINIDTDIFSEEDIGYANSSFRFGFSEQNDRLGSVIDEIEKVCGHRNIGIHLHCNSVTRSLDVYRSIAEFACRIIDKYDIVPCYIDIGGGFFGGVESKPTAVEYINVIKAVLATKVDISKTKLIVEPGSALIASPIELHSSVLDVKDTMKTRIVTTDGSRIFIDPLWAKKNYRYFVNSAVTEKKVVNEQIVCGYTCMDHDRIMVLYSEPELNVGDEIVYERVGAYSVTFAGPFIRYLPRVYVEKDNAMTLVRDQMKTEDYYKIHSV